MGEGALRKVWGFCFAEEFQFHFAVVPLKNTFLFIAKLQLNLTLHYYLLLLTCTQFPRNTVVFACDHQGHLETSPTIYSSGESEPR